LDTIELIEAAPGSRKCKTSEDLPEGNDVHLVRAVLDDYKEGQVLSEILDSLCLASSGWSLGRTTSLHVEGVGQGHVGTVCERRNY